MKVVVGGMGSTLVSNTIPVVFYHPCPCEEIEAQRGEKINSYPANFPSGSCPRRLASPIIIVKWESLANKSGGPLLPEGCHALEAILGGDVLKQQDRVLILGRNAGPEANKALLRIVHPMTRSESKSFHCL